MHSRFVSSQTSAMRKSRLEGKPSLLPKPRRPGSIDRLSSEARRPSNVGRSSSAEPPRGTFGNRPSREASATKLQFNGRSRSQQGERYGQPATTPLRNNHLSRPTTTPVRTPSGDRSPSWQLSLERALSFVVSKDQRQLSCVAWQRAAMARVSAALASRAALAGMTLMRPLTIARFVDITAALLNAITRDAKLTNDNYVTKLPHLSKRLLYPGAVSKTWLKTVNTLHAFPQALALIAYLQDLVNHIEMPVSDDWLYANKDDLSRLRREYLYKCWIMFQDPGHHFEELNEEYLQKLKALLGNDDEKIAELHQVIKKYSDCLEDEAEAAARADEARRSERRDALLSALRSERAEYRAARSEVEAQRAALLDNSEAARLLDLDVERANAESQQLKRELESQAMCVAERTRLLDEVDYAHRVQDSKRALADQVAKMVFTKENELALWQKTTLDSCVEYKQGLIHLSAQFPDLAALHIDEKELMAAECAAQAARAVEALRARCARLAEARAEHARSKTALARKRAALLEETRTKLAELKATVHREQQALEAETSKENTEASSWAAEQQQMAKRLDSLKLHQEEYAKVDAELDFWEKQDAAWRTKLSAMKEYINTQKLEAQRVLEAAREKRERLIVDSVNVWNEKLDRLDH